jgi:hypothetical protein
MDQGLEGKGLILGARHSESLEPEISEMMLNMTPRRAAVVL